MDNLQRINLYSQELLKHDTEYNLKIEDLIKITKSKEKLHWHSFSRQLEEIKDSYKDYLLGIVLQYNLEFKVNVYENVYAERADKFSKLCYKTFDDIYVLFEKTNGLV